MKLVPHTAAMKLPSGAICGGVAECLCLVLCLFGPAMGHRENCSAGTICNSTRFTRMASGGFLRAGIVWVRSVVGARCQSRRDTYLLDG
jgi:hypothetical protein